MLETDRRHPTKDKDEDTEQQESSAKAGEKPVDVRPKIRDEPTLKKQENLTKVYRDKLVSLEEKYSNKSCNKCRKRVVRPKTCSECAVPMYCSKNCRTRDWENNHKGDCKEIRKLRGNIAKQEEIEEFRVAKLCKATPSGDPWRLDNVFCSAMCFYDDKFLLLGGRPPLSNYDITLSVYDNTTGKKYFTHDGLMVTGMETVPIGSKQYMAASVVASFVAPPRLELWSYPSLSKSPVHTYTVDSKTFSFLFLKYFEANLFVSDVMHNAIRIFDVTSPKILPTNTEERISAGIMGMVPCLAVIKERGEKMLVFMQTNEKHATAIRCVNFSGQVMWEIGNLYRPILDGKPFVPINLCSDDKGHVFVVDSEKTGIFQITKDRQFHRMIDLRENIHGMQWCESTQQLYVVYLNAKETETFLLRLDLSEQYS